MSYLMRDENFVVCHGAVCDRMSEPPLYAIGIGEVLGVFVNTEFVFSDGILRRWIPGGQA